ncbi:MAG: hypothetical protein IPI60_17950 [Saprospiraceae bacterium]|nr:hypothetical protein [Saprospiraceae bacterium]
MKTGRKSKFEELQIVERYSELSQPFFHFLKEMFETGDKSDKKWAAEQLAKAYTKMIPQEVEGDFNATLQWATPNESLSPIDQEIGLPNSTTAENAG